MTEEKQVTKEQHRDNKQSNKKQHFSNKIGDLYDLRKMLSEKGFKLKK